VLAPFVQQHQGMKPTKIKQTTATRSEGGAEMDQTFYFIGDPGPHRVQRLETLRAAGLKPVRINPCIRELEGLETELPCAVVVGAEVIDRSALMAELRQRPLLDAVPIIARVREPHGDEIEQAFADGADDIIVDGAEAQFEALIASFGRIDSWSAVRAPSGLVLLADEDRQERIRLGSVLRRGGFDIRFASDLGELEHWLNDGQAPRAVVASADLPGGSLPDYLERLVADHRLHSPCVIVNADRDARVGAGDQTAAAVVYDTGHDPERLSFLMNELLAPAPPEGRRTPRLLYESIAEFIHEGSDETFFGYTYNVNAGGLFVRTLTPPPHQSRVEVRFRPPCGNGRVNAVAQVVWVSQFRGNGTATSPTGMGVQFVDWAPADRAGFEAGYQALLAMHGGQRPVNSATSICDTHPTTPPGPISQEPWSTTKYATS
jgi:CheY-like chemotaxis protein